MSHELSLVEVTEVTVLGGKQRRPVGRERPHPNPHQAGRMDTWSCCCTELHRENVHNVQGVGRGSCASKCLLNPCLRGIFILKWGWRETDRNKNKLHIQLLEGDKCYGK